MPYSPLRIRLYLFPLCSTICTLSYMTRHIGTRENVTAHLSSCLYPIRLIDIIRQMFHKYRNRMSYIPVFLSFSVKIYKKRMNKTMDTEKKILDFIKRRFPETGDNHWMDGNCYFFAVILNARFPFCPIIYSQIDGHFSVKWENYCFDFKGKHPLPSDYQYLEEIKVEDPAFYRILKRDCID